jgi:hypothetical protein
MKFITCVITFITCVITFITHVMKVITRVPSSAQNVNDRHKKKYILYKPPQMKIKQNKKYPNSLLTWTREGDDAAIGDQATEGLDKGQIKSAVHKTRGYVHCKTL